MIQIFTQVKELQDYISKAKKGGKTIGFAPTMGALHDGHMSLIDKAHEQSDIVVSSIFVNPTQFNDPADLIKYPRPLENDLRMLDSHQIDALLLPAVEEIYGLAFDHNLSLELGDLITVMEGANRPGHFEGVIDVVYRLLQIVIPDHLYMGQKDFQQFTIIQSMILQLDLPVKLVVCSIIREEDGLARSSRNVRIDSKLRPKAALLYKTLLEVKKNYHNLKPAEITKKSLTAFRKAGLRAEYFNIVDGNTLQPISSFDETEYIVTCTAVWVGDVRLIDNMIIKS